MIKPAGHRVIVKPDPVEETSESGIVIRTESETKMEQSGQIFGTLVGIGPNAWKAFDDGHAWASEGDRVIYSRYAGRYVTDPEDPDEKLVVLNDEDILATISG